MKQIRRHKLQTLLALIITQSSLFSLLALPEVKAQPPTDYYGAIAYSPSTGRYGTSWNFTSQAEANRGAMNICNRSDCQVLLPLENSCGALLRARNGGYVWSGGRTLYEAKLSASNECTRLHKSCKFVCSLCSRGNES